MTPNAQATLGIIYLTGRGEDIIRNYFRAARLLRLAASKHVPGFAEEAVTALKAHLLGTEASLETLHLDDSFVSSFDAPIHRALRRLPRGATITYGDLARQAGQPGAARAVGVAMGRNPWPIIVPCHRVLASGGKVGGGTEVRRTLVTAAPPDGFRLMAHPLTFRVSQHPQG